MCFSLSHTVANKWPDGTRRRTFGEPAEASEITIIVGRCQESNQRAWAELVATFRPLVWSTVRSFGLDADDAEDLCQATWMRVFQSIHRVREPDKIRAWIVTVAKREALRHVGRVRRDQPVGDELYLLATPCTDPTPEDRAVAAADVEILGRRIPDLPGQQRELLDMLFGDADLSYAEISHRLCIPHGSIGPTRRRLLKLLGAHLGVPYHSPESASQNPPAA